MPEPVVLIAGIASDAAYLLVIFSLVWRFIRGDERTKRQLMWLILALLIIFALNVERFLTGDGPILLLLSVVLIPIALAIAIVRYQLFDIRVVLSRTLLYGLTIAVIIAAYVGIVAGLTLPGAVECPAKRLRRRSDHRCVPVCTSAVACAADDQPRLLRHPVRPRADGVADRPRAAAR